MFLGVARILTLALTSLVIGIFTYVGAVVPVLLIFSLPPNNKDLIEIFGSLLSLLILMFGLSKMRTNKIQIAASVILGAIPVLVYSFEKGQIFYGIFSFFQSLSCAYLCFKAVNYFLE
jgi:Na+/pantothenate symporter